jgi:lipid II isoglutaminyl synthase (glutamine-hydrolysing)
VLNLFRDQLDRYGELDSTALLIGRAIANLDADIWLNADDPLVASLAEYVKAGRVHYFGVSDAPVRRLKHDWAADSDRCPKCGEALDYSVNYFSHIGHYSCPEGHFERPKPQIEIKTEAKGGLYNAYNQLAAVAAAGSLGVSAPEAGADLQQSVFGRQETFEYKGRQLTLLLIKNPTGFNQVIQTFLTDKPGPMMIAVNDNFADGRDVSWLWDVAFEETGEGELVASGIRAKDLALRLKYADRRSDVEEDLLEGVERLLDIVPTGGSAYILPTYTAMLQLRDKLKLQRFEA